MPAIDSPMMHPIDCLRDICDEAINSIKDAQAIIRQAGSAETVHVERQTLLEEEEQELLEVQEHPDAAEYMRTPTPLSEIGVNPIPEASRRRQYPATQATRTQKKEWRMGGVYDSKGRKLVIPNRDRSPSPVPGSSSRKRGRRDVDSDAENPSSYSKRVKWRVARKAVETVRVMGEDIPGPMTRSRTSGSLKRVMSR